MELRYKFTDLDKLKKAFDPKIVEKAQRSTVKKTAAKARTWLSRRARQVYTVTAGVVARHSKLENYFGDPQQPFSVIRYVGSRIGLINFASRERLVRTDKGLRRGVSVRVRKDHKRSVVKGRKGRDQSPGFIATGNNDNTHIFARRGDSKLPISAMYGPSVAEMIGREEVQGQMSAFVGSEMPAIFDHEMEYFLLKQVGLR